MAAQTLKTDGFDIQSDFEFIVHEILIRPFVNFQRENILYRDVNFLNEASNLEDQYYQFNLNGGVNFEKQWKSKGILIHGGLQNKYEHVLSASVENNGATRNQIIVATGLSKKWKKLELILKGGGRYASIINGNSKEEIIPAGGIRLIHLKKFKQSKYKVELSGAYSARMPSFGELFYNQVGNKKLNPEKSFLNELVFSHTKFINKRNYNSQLQVYYGLVEDKIVAIPSKNLFVWSIQNIDLVEVYGFDFLQSVALNFYKHWSATFSVNYAFQMAIDKTPESFNYGDQIAYIPKHSANLETTVAFKNYGIRLSTEFVGMRYSFNENIEFNEIGNYTTMALGVFSHLKINKNHSIRIQLSAKNITNTQYAFVRNYAMPGRNYLLSIKYAFS